VRASESFFLPYAPNPIRMSHASELAEEEATKHGLGRHQSLANHAAQPVTV
jgi:hypothetical protein